MAPRSRGIALRRAQGERGNLCHRNYAQEHLASRYTIPPASLHHVAGETTRRPDKASQGDGMAQSLVQRDPSGYLNRMEPGSIWSGRSKDQRPRQRKGSHERTASPTIFLGHWDRCPISPNPTLAHSAPPRGRDNSIVMSDTMSYLLFDQANAEVLGCQSKTTEAIRNHLSVYFHKIPMRLRLRPTRHGVCLIVQALDRCKLSPRRTPDRSPGQAPGSSIPGCRWIPASAGMTDEAWPVRLWPKLDSA
jgi:hypothetical protein